MKDRHPPASPLSLLLVEDNDDARAMYARYLRFMGAAVETAVTGPEAIRQAQSSRHDAIVLDLGLPEMTGLEVLEHLRRDGRTKDMPIVVVTGWTNPEVKDAATKAGADVFLTKPCLPHALFEGVMRARSARER